MPVIKPNVGYTNPFLNSWSVIMLYCKPGIFLSFRFDYFKDSGLLDKPCFSERACIIAVMASGGGKDPESEPLVQKESEQVADNVAEELTRSSLGEKLAKKGCCTFRIRVTAVIILLLIQVPVFAYYYRASYNLDFGLPAQINPRGMLNSLLAEFRDSNASPTVAAVLSNSTQVQPENVIENNSKTKNDEKDSNSINAATTKSIAVTPSNDDKNSKDLPNQKTDNSVKPDDTSSKNVGSSTSKPTSTTTQPTTTASTVEMIDGLPQCPAEPPKLVGRLAISFNHPAQSFEKTLSDNPGITNGGHGKPAECTARHKVAIIIPYRDRMEHLMYFLEYMHPVLLRQQVDYQIFIINQAGTGKFNRAKLMNVGYVESQKIYPFNCFAFHDVDLILEDDRSLYWCSDRPRHMSAGVDKFNYVLPYASIFGGVTLISKEQMDKINGFSNEFWGWGGEDDDVFNRLRLEKYKIVRYPMEIARYKMIRHKKEKGNEANPKRFEMIRKTGANYKKDGINSIKYKVLSTEFHSTYTNITVDIFPPS